MKTVRTSQTFTGKAEMQFGYDSKGRRIGAVARLGVEVFRASSAADSWYTVSEGTWYTYSPHATRDGKPFGSSHGTNCYATEAERDAAVAKYLIGAAKLAGAGK